MSLGGGVVHQHLEVRQVARQVPQDQQRRVDLGDDPLQRPLRLQYVLPGPPSRRPGPAEVVGAMSREARHDSVVHPLHRLPPPGAGPLVAVAPELPRTGAWDDAEVPAQPLK